MASAFVTYAGDMPESLLSNENAKIFTAIVMNKSKDTVKLKVVCKLKGDIAENEIVNVPYFEFFGRKDRTPEKDDLCLISIVDGKSFYSYKTTSTDPRTLKFKNLLTNASMNMVGDSQDERFEKYVNNGDYEKSDQTPRTKDSAITSNHTDTKQISTNHIDTNQKEINHDTKVQKEPDRKDTSKYKIIGGIIIGIVIMSLVIIIKRKK